MRKISIITVIFLLASVTIIVSFACGMTNNVLKIGGKDMVFENDIYTIDEKVYVPVRELFERLNIPVVWNETENKVEILTDHKSVNISDGTEFKEEGVIPDERMAYEVGKQILEKYIGKPLEYETERGVYYLQATYHELDNSWRIAQECKYKQGGGGGTSNYSPTIVLNKNTGEVTFINTNSAFGE